MTISSSVKKKWEVATLADVLAKIETGTSPKALDRPASAGELGVLKVSAVTWQEFRPRENKALPSDFEGRGIPTVAKGDLLLSRANTAELLASPVIVKDDYPHLILSDKTLRLVLRTEAADARFVLYALRQREARHFFVSNATGTSGSMRNVSQATIRRCPIPLPPLAEQKRIAAILDAADALRAMRRESLAQLDTLLQSTFLDMFGDPVTNPKGWEVVDFKEVGTSRLGKMLDKGKEAGNCQFPYLANFNVQWGRFVLDDLRCMDFTEKDRKAFELKDGDLLVCEGGEVGRTAIWRGEMEDVYFQKALHRVRLNPSKSVPEYVQQYMWFMAKNGGFRDFTNSATIAHLTGVKLKALPFPLPPFDLQRRFAAIVESVEQQKARLREHLTKLDTLFASLQQRAFNGDL